MFGLCKNNMIANTGLYMGYVKYLKLIFNKISGKCYNDQRNINSICKYFDFIKIDSEDYIFSNNNNSNSCFIHTPGNKGKWDSFKYFSQFYLIEISLLFVILFIISKKYRIYILIVYIILIVLLLLIIDTSCI